MTYQIDQSGKIEQTEKDTVIAYANDGQRAILIPRKLKRRVQESFRLHGMTSVFIYFLFSVGITYLLYELEEIQHITIDEEYSGKEDLIQRMVRSLLKEFDKPLHDIRFARIGNTPRVHYAAKDVFDKKRKPDRILTMEDVIEALKKTDGRLRACLATLVDAQPRPYKSTLPKQKRKVKNL